MRKHRRPGAGGCDLPAASTTILTQPCFRSDSMLGVRGLMEGLARRPGAIANARPATGVADDQLDLMPMVRR